MKKCIFYRTTYGKEGVKAVKTEGFCETLTDKNGNEITLCFHNRYPNETNTIWIVTEKSTGFKVCQGNKRMEALEEAKKYIDFIYDKIQSLGRYQEIIAEAYAEG